MEERHAVAGAGVVTARSPVLQAIAGRAQNLRRAVRHLLCPAAERGDLGIAERAVPQRDVVDQAVEPGARAVRGGGPADQQRCGAGAGGADGEFLVHQHPVDEQLEGGPGEAYDQVMPDAGIDACDGKVDLHDAVARLAEQRFPAAAPLQAAHDVGARRGAPGELHHGAAAGHGQRAVRGAEQIAVGGVVGTPGVADGERLGGAVGAFQEQADAGVVAVAAEQRRLPGAPRVADPQAQRELLSGKVARYRSGDFQVAAAEAGGTAVAAAAARGVRRVRRQLHAEGDDTVDREPASAACLPCVGQVPEGGRIRERRRRAHEPLLPVASAPRVSHSRLKRARETRS